MTPEFVREDIEWCDVWLPEANARDRPRVLLIGDSITRAYGGEVEKQLRDRACVGRLATSKSIGDRALLTEIAMVLDSIKVNLIHFNNGLHGWGYSEEQYQKAFPGVLGLFRRMAPRARIIWATTTPVRQQGALESFDAKTERVRARNKIAAVVVEREKIAVNDLFALAKGHPEHYAPDGVHFSAVGVAAQAEQVAAKIAEVLEAKAS